MPATALAFFKLWLVHSSHSLCSVVLCNKRLRRPLKALASTPLADKATRKHTTDSILKLVKKGEKGSALASKEEMAAMTKFFHDLSSPKRQMEVVKAAAAVVSVSITDGPLQDALEHLESLAGPKQKSKHPNKQQKEAGGKEEASPNKVDVEAKTNAPDGDGGVDQKKRRASTRLFSI